VFAERADAPRVEAVESADGVDALGRNRHEAIVGVLVDEVN